VKRGNPARRRRIAVVAAATAAGTAAALTAAMAGPSAAAPGAPPAGEVAVSQGLGPAVLKNASVFGATPPDTPETVSFILRGRNLSYLASAIEDGRSPDLSVPRFASEFGQLDSLITALESYLGQYGIQARSYPDNLDVTATGTAGEFDKALSVQQEQFAVPAAPAHDGMTAIPAQDVHGTLQLPYLPAGIGTSVLAILGLTNYAPFSDDLTHTPQGVTSSDSTPPTATYTGNLKPSDFASAYDLGPLQAAGIRGQGETLGIVTLAGFDPGAAYHFWRRVLHIATKRDRITVVNVDGGPGAPSEAAGSGESDLDVEQSGALAPDADVVVYQAPNTDYGFADGFFDAASQNAADTLSSSWGESETVLLASVVSGEESPAYAQAFDEAFLELAAQGQSTFVAAGDSGAYDAANDIGTTNLAVDNPGDSPFVTAAGGTTLGGTITATVGGVNVQARMASQRTWGWNWLWPHYQAFGFASEAAFAAAAVAGGGGGYSGIEPAPAYQQALQQRGGTGTGSYSDVPYLTPAAFTTVDGLYLPTQWTFDAAPPVQQGTADGRAMPDLSADADPFTGYLLYDPLASPALQGGWGGTSFVAPQLNGSAALIDQYVGHRVGLWNPAIYSFAASAGSPFTPLDAAGASNDNLYYTGTPGQIYNAGSGLGQPDLAKLAGDFRG
jgi:kumamolisin